MRSNPGRSSSSLDRRSSGATHEYRSALLVSGKTLRMGLGLAFLMARMGSARTLACCLDDRFGTTETTSFRCVLGLRTGDDRCADSDLL
jgi:hypothetical protein